MLYLFCDYLFAKYTRPLHSTFLQHVYGRMPTTFRSAHLWNRYQEKIKSYRKVRGKRLVIKTSGYQEFSTCQKRNYLIFKMHLLKMLLYFGNLAFQVLKIIRVIICNHNTSKNDTSPQVLYNFLLKLYYYKICAVAFHQFF